MFRHHSTGAEPTRGNAAWAILERRCSLSVSKDYMHTATPHHLIAITSRKAIFLSNETDGEVLIRMPRKHSHTTQRRMPCFSRAWRPAEKTPKFHHVCRLVLWSNQRCFCLA